MKALVAWWGKICEWLRVPGPPDGVGRSHFRWRDVVGAGVCLNQEAEMNFSFKKSHFLRKVTLWPLVEEN